jgi:hypothetical protein
MQPRVAISIKQPWAALVAAGLKFIEVRTWSARRVGPVLIHAGKTADDRPEGWSLVTTPGLAEMAAFRGGFIGLAEVAGCRRYDTPEAFAADSAAHLNPREWFAPPRLFGFLLRDVRPVTFYPYPGQTFFFKVRGVNLEERNAQLQEGIDEQVTEDGIACECAIRGRGRGGPGRRG